MDPQKLQFQGQMAFSRGSVLVVFKLISVSMIDTTHDGSLQLPSGHQPPALPSWGDSHDWNLQTRTCGFV